MYSPRDARIVKSNAYQESRPHLKIQNKTINYRTKNINVIHDRSSIMPKFHQDRSIHTATFFDYSYVLEKAEAQYKLGVITRDQFLRIRTRCEQKLEISSKTEKKVSEIPTIE